MSFDGDFPPPPPPPPEDSPPSPAHSILPPSPAAPPSTKVEEAKTTCNSFQLEILSKLECSPFPDFKFCPSPLDYSNSLFQTYCPLSLQDDAPLSDLRTNDDILICSPIRSGQSALLDALFLLCHTNNSSSSLLEEDYTGWLGSSFSHQTPLLRTSSGKRLFKTHLSVKSVVTHRLVKASSSNSPKLIFLFRDPCCLLESWKRHLEEVFHTFHPNGKEVANLSVDDFKTCFPNNTVYEEMISALDCVAKNKQQCLVVFYEQIVAEPELLLGQLADFVGVTRTAPVQEAILSLWKSKLSPSLNQASLSHPLQLFMTESFRNAFSASFIQGMPITPQDYYELFKTFTGNNDYPLTVFLGPERPKSRVTFSASKSAATKLASSGTRLASSGGSAVLSVAKNVVKKIDGSSATGEDSKGVETRKSMFFGGAKSALQNEEGEENEDDMASKRISMKKVFARIGSKANLLLSKKDAEEEEDEDEDDKRDKRKSVYARVFAKGSGQ